MKTGASEASAQAGAAGDNRHRPADRGQRAPTRREPASQGAMAAAFAKLQSSR